MTRAEFDKHEEGAYIVHFSDMKSEICLVGYLYEDDLSREKVLLRAVLSGDVLDSITSMVRITADVFDEPTKLKFDVPRWLDVGGVCYAMHANEIKEFEVISITKTFSAVIVEIQREDIEDERQVEDLFKTPEALGEALALRCKFAGKGESVNNAGSDYQGIYSASGFKKK